MKIPLVHFRLDLLALRRLRRFLRVHDFSDNPRWLHALKLMYSRDRRSVVRSLERLRRRRLSRLQLSVRLLCVGLCWLLWVFLCLSLSAGPPLHS